MLLIIHREVGLDISIIFARIFHDAFISRAIGGRVMFKRMFAVNKRLRGMVLPPVSFLFRRINCFRDAFAAIRSRNAADNCADCCSHRSSDRAADCRPGGSRTSGPYSSADRMRTGFACNWIRIAVCFILFAHNNCSLANVNRNRLALRM